MSSPDNLVYNKYNLNNILINLLNKFIKILINIRFAILILFIIIIFSSIGSIIEQDQPSSFYQDLYPEDRPIYGFITSKLILFFGFDHVYKSIWFLSLFIILAFSLVGCSIIRQFPLFTLSKEYFFKKEKTSFSKLTFFSRFINLSTLSQYILQILEERNFYIYQKKDFLYAYRGLIGRVSPILVHVSLILILGGSLFGSLKNFQAQEFLPKGEICQIQNPISVGFFTSFPKFGLRVNDFWVEYKREKIHQFYSDLSILNTDGNEKKHYTISVNNPLRYKGLDIYQSDWNLIGIRAIKTFPNQQKNASSFRSVYEFPLFPISGKNKSWITWIKDEDLQSKKSISKNQGQKNNLSGYYVVFDQFQGKLFKYDENGKFLLTTSITDKLDSSFIITDVIPSTGLLIKDDPSIPIIYFGFGLLMLTTFLSLLPYNQIWLFEDRRAGLFQNKLLFSNYYFGASSNRGKIQLEIEFENLTRKFKNIGFSINGDYFSS